MNTCLQGRKIPREQNSERPSQETLHLVRKLRWIGMDDEAEQLQMHASTPIGGVIAVARETD